MKASVDQSACIGCGLCESICPEVFRMTDDSVAEAYGEVTSANQADAEEARDNCPVEVITVE